MYYRIQNSMCKIEAFAKGLCINNSYVLFKISTQSIR